MNIYDIKRLTEQTSPYFFSRKTLKFFNQTMRDFKLKKQADGRVKIQAPMKDHAGNYVGKTVRYFNPSTNNLDRE